MSRRRMMFGDDFCLLEQTEPLKFLRAEFRVMMINIQRTVAVEFQTFGELRAESRHQHGENFSANG